MPVDITKSLSSKVQSEVGQEQSRCAPPGRTERREARGLMSAVEWTLIRAMAAADSSLRLGEHIGLGIVSAQDCPKYALHRKEAGILSPRARSRKQIEFASGRAASHFALKQIGFLSPPPVLRGQKGEPLWPKRIVGSITHCYPWSVAVAIRCPNIFATGVDLETTKRMTGGDISELVCGSAELDWVRAGDAQERLTMIFSAKEAIYKVFYPLYQRYIDFKDVELTWVPTQSCFHAKSLAPFGPSFPRGRVCAVHCGSYTDFIFSCMIHRSQ